MATTVRIKSYPNKIVLYLDESTMFEKLLEDIQTKFRETAHFFGNAKMILTLTGRELSESEEQQIIDVITESSSLEILYLDNPVAKSSSTEQEIMIAPKTEEETKQTQHERKETVRFYKSSLSDGDVLESPCDLVILGNVSSGATVISRQSIFVYGGLYGEACAGYETGKDYVVSAFDFFPTKITIGDLEYYPNKGRKWKKKNQFYPQIAYVKNEEIVTDQITKDLLDSLI